MYPNEDTQGNRTAYFRRALVRTERERDEAIAKLAQALDELMRLREIVERQKSELGTNDR